MIHTRLFCLVVKAGSPDEELRVYDGKDLWKYDGHSWGLMSGYFIKTVINVSSFLITHLSLRSYSELSSIITYLFIAYI